MHVSIFCSFWKFISWTNMPKLWCLTPILIPVPVYLNKTWESELNWVHLSMTSFSTHYSYFVPVLIALRIIQLKFWTCKFILKLVLMSDVCVNWIDAAFCWLGVKVLHLCLYEMVVYMHGLTSSCTLFTVTLFYFIVWWIIGD